MDNLINCVSNMGPLDWPTFKTYALINALGGKFEYMQSQIHASANDPRFSANTVVARILQENDLIRNRTQGGEGTSALVSHTGRHERSPLTCSHCKRTGHTADFCILCGGKFYGHSLEEAHIAQCAALANNKTQTQNVPLSANITTGDLKEASRPTSPIPQTITTTMPPNTFTINGITYGPIASIPANPPPLSSDLANIALLLIKDPNFPFSAFHTEGQASSHVSFDWSDFCHPNTDYNDNFLSAYSTLQLNDHHHPHDSSFVLDSGASVHISPDQSDFKSLNPIAPHLITGLGGSCIYVSGVGTIELSTKSGKQITLNHVLFVPNSTVCLISVFSLNNDGLNACYFNAKTCSVLDSNGHILLKGRAWV